MLPPSLWYALDLFNLLNLEARILAELALDEERHKDSPLRVRVYAAAGAPVEGREEERGTSRWFVDLRSRSQEWDDGAARWGCTSGRRRYSLVLKSITNMSVGFISSFCTPLGAMKILSS